MVHRIGAAGFLLFTELEAVLARLTLPGLSMLARRGGAVLLRALGREALLALEEELGALAAAHTAHGIGISCHVDCTSSKSLHSSTLGRTASVVRNGCNVFDHVDFQTRGLQAADGSLTPGTGTLDIDLDGLEAKLHGGLRGGLGGHLRGERRGLLASAEAQATSAGPAEGAVSYTHLAGYAAPDPAAQ